VASGEVALPAAFQSLADYQDELARAAADMREREVWTLTALLASSGPLWQDPARPLLRFLPDRPDEPYLALGSYAHLRGLVTPSADDQALIAATTPCWARVAPHRERQLASGTGALGCSYVPVAIAEAVAILGFERILTQIEAFASGTGQALLAQAMMQRERQARLLAVERKLGWTQDPAEAPPSAMARTGPHPLLVLLKQGGAARWALLAALAGLMLIMVCLLPL
jgi:hypothetical protein